MPTLRAMQSEADAEEMLFRIDRMLKKSGMRPMTPEELRAMHQRYVQQASQGLPPNGGSRIAGEPPPGSAEASPRNLQFRSSVPIQNALGPVRPVDDLQGGPDRFQSGAGFSAANPVMTDQGFLRDRLRNRLGGPI